MTISTDDWDAVAKEREEGTPQATLPEPAPEPEHTPEPAPAEDPPAPALPDEVKSKLARLDELAATMPQLVNELREAKGRISALQSQWDKSKQHQAEQPTARQVAAATKDPEKWAQLKGEFPEWGEAISEFVETKLSGVSASPAGLSQEQIEQLVAQRTETAYGDLRKQVKQANEALVTLSHKTWRKDINSPEFGSWFSGQPADVQALAESPLAEDAIAMLDLYAAHKATSVKEVRENRQQKLAAAVTSTKPSAGGAVSKKFEDMTPSEQWNYLARQRESTS